MEHLVMWLAIMAVIAAGARHLARHGRSNPRTSALRKWPTEIHHPVPTGDTRDPDEPRRPAAAVTAGQ